jgi:hypothetical protein
LLNVLQEDFPCHLGREATFFNAERRNTWPLFKASLSPNSLQVQAVGLDSLTKLDEVQILIQIRKNTTEGDKFYQVEVITHCLERDAKANGGERVIKSQEKSLNILFGIGWMVKGESRFAGDFDEMRFSHVLTLLKRASHSRWNMYGERRSEEEERQVIGELGGLFAIVRSTWGTLETAIQNADWNMNFEG